MSFCILGNCHYDYIPEDDVYRCILCGYEKTPADYHKVWR